jgi:transposase
MDVTTIGIDIAKNVFQLVAVDKNSRKVWEKRIQRSKLIELMSTLKPCRIVMEACGSSNYWSRTFTQLGHVVKLIPPQYVKPFVTGNKTDSRDAHAIVDADSRPNMRYVEPKTIEQQDIQSLLRIRDIRIDMRTQISNQIRGLLAEYGIVVKLGIPHLRKILPELFAMDTDNGLTSLLKELLEAQYNALLLLEQQIDEFDIQLTRIAKENETCQRLQQIEGVGVITAVAVLACVGEGKGFNNGRHFAAFLGLVPRQHSSGGREQLLGISKRGDNYLRKLFIHGGRSVVQRAHKKTDARSQWIEQLKVRRGVNRTAVAIANKNARIVMALLLNKEVYKKAA